MRLHQRISVPNVPARRRQMSIERYSLNSDCISETELEFSRQFVNRDISDSSYKWGDNATETHVVVLFIWHLYYNKSDHVNRESDIRSRGLRVNVCKDHRYRGHSSKFDVAHTLYIGRPKYCTYEIGVYLIR